ncbi:adenylyl-sulfate kinase [candidate division CSSED10-310 bacterium]|uniref:Adenylyl-sulfate kinase n=1 Tax=candidate division CSSED10-310 bacterium TaxID=2855610 RepID=A0ABV6Z0F3_UNCC1
MDYQKAKNIVKHETHVCRPDRERKYGHRSFTLWFTGLPASGKSSLASAVEKILHDRGLKTYLLDGDNVRHGLNKNLGFSPEDRQENIRRLSEVAKLFRDAGIINLIAFISPYRRERDFARSLSQGDDFIEIFVDCPVSVCEKRDPKGMYEKARQGIIKEYTGISAPYEAPENPEIHVRTDALSLAESTTCIIDYLHQKELIRVGSIEMVHMAS